MAIELSKNYISLLDEVYKQASVTSILDSGSDTVKKGNNANEIIVPMLSMDGMADYSRNDGYVKGDVNLTHETIKFNFDRGRLFEVDSMDNEESAEIAFGKLAAEFIRTRVAPEVDAFTFATYAGKENISKVDAGVNLTTGAEVTAALRTAVSKMNDDEVPHEDRHLFITSTLLGLVEEMDTTKSKEVLKKFASITEVPQSRFYTAIKLNDGKTDGEKKGGYTKAAEGKDINFMIIHKSAVLKFDKHVANDIIEPSENQHSDGYLQKYRKYGLVDVYQNKVAGVYLHHKA